MKPTMKHISLIALAILVLGGMFAIAQAVAVPLSQAPNDNITGITSRSVLGPLSVGQSAIPTSGIGLDIAGKLRIERDYLNKPLKWNCLDSSGSNKCHTQWKLPGSTATARSLYPDFLSSGSANFAGQSGAGLVVIGHTTNSTVSGATFPVLTAGTKLDITGTTGTLQGDPGVSYMNHSGGYKYPNGGTCTDPTNPTCKKVACITTGTSTMTSCTDNTQATTYTPQRPACSDGIDNDGDGTIDGADLGCWCGGMYDQIGTRSCGPQATESSPNNPACPMPC